MLQRRDEGGEAHLPTRLHTPSFPFFLPSAAGLSSRLAKPVLVLSLYKGILLPRLPLLGCVGGGQVAADSQVVRRRLDNSDWLLLKMEDELIGAQGVCDLKGWGTALRAECIFRRGGGGVIPSCQTH